MSASFGDSHDLDSPGSDMKIPGLRLFNEVQVLRQTDISNFQLASFVHECVNGLSPQFFENYFASLTSKHNKLKNTTVYERKFVFRKAEYNYVWNKIDSVFRCEVSSTIKQFWTKLKKYYLTSYETTELFLNLSFVFL